MELAWGSAVHGDSLGRSQKANNNMTHPTKLLRGAVSAIALLGAAPMVAGLPVLGVVAVQAQEQLVASVLFEGNRRFSDADLLKMVDVSASGVYTQQRLNADIESIRQAYDSEGFMSVGVSARTTPAGRGNSTILRAWSTRGDTKSWPV